MSAGRDRGIRIVEAGIRQLADGRYLAYVRVTPRPLQFKRFRRGTSLQAVRRWRADTRHALELARGRPAGGTLAADVPSYLDTLTDRPALRRERAVQLAWWVHRFGHRARHTITSHEIRVALIELRTAGNPLLRCRCGRPRPSAIVRRGQRVPVEVCHACRTALAAAAPLPVALAAPQGQSRSSCDHYRFALYDLYTALDGRAAPNPVKDVPVFGHERLQPRALSYDLVRLLLDAMSDQGQAHCGGDRVDGSKAKARVRVLAFTGMRHSELKRAQPHHWDRAARTLYIDTGKAGAARTIPLDDDGMAALATLARLEAWGPFSNSTLHRAFRKALARLDLRGIRPYDLRHSYGTLLYRVTGDLRIVAEMLGHRSARTTQRYTLGFVPDYMRIAVERFAQASQPGGSPPVPLPPTAERQLRVLTGGR